MSVTKSGRIDMPARDGTGPLGQGPFSERGFGACPRQGGKNFGRGYGFRNTSVTAPTTKEALALQLENLERQLEEVQNRMNSLK
jgi:hypothetical protein